MKVCLVSFVGYFCIEVVEMGWDGMMNLIRNGVVYGVMVLIWMLLGFFFLVVVCVMLIMVNLLVI